MIKLHKIILVLLLIIPSVYAYIDPGTGGYLLSSLWGWLVGFFVVLFAIIIHFFKHKVKKWWKKIPVKYKLIIFLIINEKLSIIN